MNYYKIYIKIDHPSIETTKIKIIPLEKKFLYSVTEIDKQENQTYNNSYFNIRFFLHIINF